MVEQVKQFNSQQYLFEITLLPYDEAVEPVKINPDAVVQLVIEEELLIGCEKGFLTFQNSNEMFQRQIKNIGDTNLSAKAKSAFNNVGYIFRNDGKDRLHIRIKPIKTPNLDNPEIDEVPDEGWLKEITANIYDVEDPMVNDIGSKLKRLYFHDHKYQKMTERDLLSVDNKIWSTATSKMNPNYGEVAPSLATDEQRKMFTGDAIRDILENSLGFEIDEDNFDIGRTKMFHTATAGSSPLDNITYLWEHHLSEKQLPSEYYDISLILCDPDTEKFQFMPLSKIFENAGKGINEPGIYQIEHLFIEDVGTQDKADKVWMAPVLRTYDPNLDVKITKLKKYSFTEMSGVDSTRDLVSKSVHTYDSKSKTFSKHSADSQIKDVPNALQQDYITDKLFVKGNENTNIDLNKIKTDNLKHSYKFTPIADGDVAQRLGHASLILKSIFFNNCLTVELEGSTNRRVGRFIGVDRYHNNENEFDYSMCGQWLITRISHNFFKNSYVNEVNMVKPQVYDKITFNKEEDVV